MTRPDDELVRRYQEASAQEDARPGAHVRDAVRAHAQMVAAAAATAASTDLTATAAPSRGAANQSRWKISALATVALVGLTGLLMLQFERGTPEERDIAFGQRRAQTPAPAAVPAPEPSAPPSAPSAPATPAPPESARGSVRDLANSPPHNTAQKSAAAAPGPSRPLAKAAPPAAPAAAEAVPAPSESESLQHPGAAGAPSGFPASPPTAEQPATTPRPPPAPAPSAAAPPRAEMRERSAMQDESPSRAQPAPHQASPSVARGLPGGNRANSDAEAAAKRVQKAVDPSLPRALRDAAGVGNAREVESLINQGVPVDARDTAGRTALMIAALNGHTAATQKLLALGAQTSLVDGDGLTAAQHARRWGYVALADLIDAAR